MSSDRPAGAGTTRKAPRGGVMKPAEREAMFERLRAIDPAPRTELEYGSPFQLLAAVLLSAQATDRSVNLVTRRLFPVAGTPAAIAALGEEGLIPYLQTIGLFRAKAKHLAQTARLLLERHRGEVPRARDALEALPGVGRKTANVVLNVAFGEPTMPVDTHVFRVANRTGLAPGRNVDEVERKLLRNVPAAFATHAHHWLILHGRYLCKARRPECWRCPIADLCRHRPKTPDPDDVQSRQG
jgi:endonuclease-3